MRSLSNFKLEITVSFWFTRNFKTHSRYFKPKQQNVHIHHSWFMLMNIHEHHFWITYDRELWCSVPTNSRQDLIIFLKNPRKLVIWSYFDDIILAQMFVLENNYFEKKSTCFRYWHINLALTDQCLEKVDFFQSNYFQEQTFGLG